MSLLKTTCAIVLLLVSARVTAAQTPALSITAPTDGQMLHGGETFDVIVSVTNAAALTMVAVVGDEAFGASGRKAAEAQTMFTFAVPAAMPPGEYRLTAMGLRADADALSSPSVRIVVAPPQTMSALRISNRVMRFDYPGMQLPLDVLGTAGDVTFRMPPQLLAFEPQHPAIATVDAAGIVTARAPGSTQIVVRHASGAVSLSQSVSIDVAGALRGDLNGDDRVDLSDVNELATWLNTPPTSPTDARDLNGDGKIDALDSRVLTTLCSSARCALP